MSAAREMAELVLNGTLPLVEFERRMGSSAAVAQEEQPAVDESRREPKLCEACGVPFTRAIGSEVKYCGKHQYLQGNQSRMTSTPGGRRGEQR
jgi:hypothetical protein